MISFMLKGLIAMMALCLGLIWITVIVEQMSLWIIPISLLVAMLMIFGLSLMMVKTFGEEKTREIIEKLKN